jgi:hypothetical protein
VLTDVQLGNIAVRLALDFPSWVERRTQRIGYLDPRTTRWTVGVMFRWPDATFFAAGMQPGDGELVYVPLDLLRKDTLASLEGTRPDGSPFPILPYIRSVRLAYIGIAGLVLGEAERRGFTDLDEKTHAILRGITAGSPDRACNLVNAALADSGEELSSLLAGDHPVRGLLEELAQYVMLLVPAPYKAGEEAVYRYTYRAGLADEEPPWRTRAWQRLRFQDVAVRHPDLPIGWSHSYHFEVEAPNEVCIPRARLEGSYRNSKSERVSVPVAEAEGKVVDLHARRPTEQALDHPVSHLATRPPLLPPPPDSRSTQAWIDAALHSQPTDPARDDRGWVYVWLRLQPFGTFLVTTVIACLTALLLMASTVRLRDLEGQTGAALLLALPGLTLGYMTKPGEHAFTTRLLGGIRGAALVVGLCSLWVAWMLAGGFVHHEDSTGPAVSCASHLTDVPVRPSSHHTWRSTTDRDVSELVCHTGKTAPGTTHIGSFARATAVAATGLAGMASLWLLAGLAYTWRRGNGMPPRAKAVDPSSSKN